MNVKQDLHVVVSSVIVVFNISCVADLPGEDSIEVVELNLVIIVGTSIVVVLVLSNVESKEVSVDIVDEVEADTIGNKFRIRKLVRAINEINKMSL